MLTDTEPMELQINKLVEANQNLKTIGCGATNDKSLAYLIVMALPELLSMLQAELPWLTLPRPENGVQMGRTRIKTETKRNVPTVKRKVTKPQNVSKRRMKRKRQTLPK